MAKLSYLTKIEKKALQEFKKKITQKLAGEILDLKLFGSKIRGDYKKTSDIDILVVLKHPDRKSRDIIYQAATDLLLKYNLDLSVKIFSKKEYQQRLKLQIPFFLIIEKEGISLCNLK